MAEITRAGGRLRLTVPDSLRVAPEATPTSPAASTGSRTPPVGRRRGASAVPLPPDATTSAPPDDPLIAALAQQELELLDRVELEPATHATPTTGDRRSLDAAEGSASPSEAVTEFEVDLDPHEDAVLLLEQDGMYSWDWQGDIAQVPAGAVVRGVPSSPARKRVTFRVSLSATPSAAPPSGVRRGVVSDFLFGRIKAYVLKFAARIVVDEGIKYLERNVRRGLVSLNSLAVEGWKPVSDPAKLRLPEDRPARVLLFVHGTFSSTIGAFGVLGATPWGRKFLEAAQSNYDLVLGYDHATLSEGPLSNATELLGLLENVNWKHPPHFDVITHSRGGLVVRSLLEYLLPLSSWQAHFDRVVFVAATNGGTRLAEPDNWATLIDLYTNIAVAVFKVIGLFPQAKPTTTLLSELIQGLGAFVKYCATRAVTDGGVPGLAAMEPDGDFVQKLNEAQPGQPTVEKSYYCAVTSEFTPRLRGEHEPQELPLRLLQWAANKVTGALMGQPNDLVVDTPAMTAIDLNTGNFLKDRYDFGQNPQVYHTNYFLQPDVTNALTRWLRLVNPAVVAAAANAGASKGQPVKRVVQDETIADPGIRYFVEPYNFDDLLVGRTRSMRPRGGLRGGGAAGGSPVIAVSPYRVKEGASVGAETPAAIDTDIIIATAGTPIGACRQAIETANPSYVVVSRPHHGETLNYAFSAEEIMEQAASNDSSVPLIDAMNLHETDASEERPLNGSMEPPQPRGARSLSRGVVLSDDGPIGVLPEKSEPRGVSELVKLAGLSTRAGDPAGRILLRRAMPTFDRKAGAAVTERFDRMAAMRFPTTSLEGSPSVPPAHLAPPPVTCRFHAEMDEEVVLDRTATVEVIVSREVIERATGIASQTGEAQIDESRKLIIQVFPKINFESRDEGRAEIDPPPPGRPQKLLFDVRATDVGEGEVQVIARQGQIPLCTLSLKPQIVATRGAAARKTSVVAETTEAKRLPAPLDQMTIRERRNGKVLTYEYQLDFANLPGRHWEPSAPFKGKREAYVARLYEKIEDRWISTNNDVEAFTEELRAFGGALYDELFPKNLQRFLWKHRARLNSIQVISDEPFIPWELVHLKDPDEPGLPDETIFMGQLGVVRWLGPAGWPPDQLKVREGRAHYVIPHYPHPDYKLPEAEEEAKFLEEKFKAERVEPQINPVRELLKRAGTLDLLHFACHGAAEMDNKSEARLLLEGRIEGGQYIKEFMTAEEAGQYMRIKGTDNAPMIVLNACQAGRAGYKLTGIGGFAQAFLLAGAGVFVGTLWSVGDTPARTFTETLYKELLEKQATLAEATINAREAARLAGDATWLAYVVYGYPYLRLTRS